MFGLVFIHIKEERFMANLKSVFWTRSLPAGFSHSVTSLCITLENAPN